MASESYHEPYDLIAPPTRDLHRAIVSLMEELEAVDWYQQRADVCSDEELRAVLVHNKNEEIEHAMMVLEWLRRNDPVFEKNIRTYLLKEGPITEIEARESAAENAAELAGSGGGAGEAGGAARTRAKPAGRPGGRGAAAGRGAPGTLGIGSLKEG